MFCGSTRFMGGFRELPHCAGNDHRRGAGFTIHATATLLHDLVLVAQCALTSAVCGQRLFQSVATSLETPYRVFGEVPESVKQSLAAKEALRDANTGGLGHDDGAGDWLEKDRGKRGKVITTSNTFRIILRLTVFEIAMVAPYRPFVLPRFGQMPRIHVHFTL